MKKYIGKPFSDLVKDIENPKEFKIKLGTADGGAFIYCGDLETFVDELWDRNDQMEKKYHEKIERQEKALENAVYSFPSMSDYIFQNLKKKRKVKSVGNVLDYINYLDGKFNALQERVNKLERMKEVEYLPLEHRTIRDIYPSVDEYNTYICLLEGEERGDFWTTNEYVNGVDEDSEEE